MTGIRKIFVVATFVLAVVSAQSLVNDATLLAQVTTSAPDDPETMLNSVVDGQTFSPRMVTLSNTNIAIQYFTYTNYRVQSRIVDQTGKPVTSEMMVGSPPSSSMQGNPYIAALPAGGYVQSWLQFGSSDGTLQAQVYDNSGNKVGAEFRLNTANSFRSRNNQNSIAVLPNGRMVFIYTVCTVSSPETFVAMGQVFSGPGVRVGSEFTVTATGDVLGGSVPHVVALGKTGNFVVAFVRTSTSTGLGIGLQKFDQDGKKLGDQINLTMGADIIKNFSTWSYLTMATLKNGGFVLTYPTNNGKVLYQIFDDSMNVIKGETQIQNTGGSWPVVTATADGGFLNSWTQGTRIYLARFDMTGNMVGTIVQPNTFTGDVSNIWAIELVSTDLVMVGWTSTNQASTTSQQDVYIRIIKTLPAKSYANCVTIYSECDFKGDSMIVCENVPNMAATPFTKTIRSIKVPADVKLRVFANTDYNGGKYEVVTTTSCIDQGSKVFKFLQSGAESFKIKKTAHHFRRGHLKRQH